MALVTLQEAKAHLKVTSEAGDTDLEAKIRQAEAIVLNRCNGTEASRAVTAAWTASTLPLPVRSAILIMLAHLYVDLGEDQVRASDVSASVDRLIISYKGLV